MQSNPQKSDEQVKCFNFMTTVNVKTLQFTKNQQSVILVYNHFIASNNYTKKDTINA